MRIAPRNQRKQLQPLFTMMILHFLSQNFAEMKDNKSLPQHMEKNVGIKKSFCAKIILQRKEVREMRNRTPMKPEATSAMKQFKMEVANELGIPDYENMDKGNLSSRENGYVGGNMTRKMVSFAEQSMANNMNNVNNINNSISNNTRNTTNQ